MQPIAFFQKPVRIVVSWLVVQNISSTYLLEDFNGFRVILSTLLTDTLE